MKLRLFAILATILALVACKRDAYRIDGIYTKDDGAEVYLIDLDGSDTLGVTAVTAGKFAFTGKIPQPAYVSVGNGKERVRMILEPGTATVNIDERTASGLPMMDAVNAYNERFYGFDKVRREAREALTARKAELNPAEFSVAWDELNAVCTQGKTALCDSMVRSNKDNLLGAIIMNDLSMVNSDAFASLYEILAEPIRNHSLVSAPYARVQALADTAPGKMFTDYTVPGGNPDGTDIKLSDYVGKGKYILLDHWASWCGPCKAEMPYIRKAWEAFHGDRFDVVSIAVSDKREDTEAELAKLGLPWPQILDGAKIPSQLYGVNAIPHLILFAPDGTIVRRDLRGEQICAALEDILK
ncbi:MAG: AhpC/TSA family protein [Bacteroidales bacterium]|nr:AhpC/TSA family protein [Bacteroidales bacterium]